MFPGKGNIQNCKTWGQDAKMCGNSYPGQSGRLSLEGAASQDGMRLRHLPMFPFSGGRGHPSCSGEVAGDPCLGLASSGLPPARFPASSNNLLFSCPGTVPTHRKGRGQSATEFSKSGSEGEKESGEGAALSGWELTERRQGNTQNRQGPVARPTRRGPSSCVS